MYLKHPSQTDADEELIMQDEHERQLEHQLLLHPDPRDPDYPIQQEDNEWVTYGTAQ